MAIYYVENNQIDRQKWDNCVQKAANSMPYCYSWYLDIVAPQWDALILDDYSAIMPLTWKKKWKFRYLHQPFFTQQLGIFAIEPPDKCLVHNFLNAIPSKFKYIDVYLNYANHHPIEACFNKNERLNYVLSLNDKYEKLYLDYKSSTKNNIRKSLKANLTINTQIEVQQIVELFQNAAGTKIKNLQHAQYQQLISLCQACIDQKMAETYGIYNEQFQLIAAIFLIRTPTRLINIISASNAEARQKRLMFKLIDNVIKIYAQTNTILDFEGSMIADIATFNRGFGAKETYYWHLLKNQLPSYLKWLKK